MNKLVIIICFLRICKRKLYSKFSQVDVYIKIKLQKKTNENIYIEISELFVIREQLIDRWIYIFKGKYKIRKIFYIEKICDNFGIIHQPYFKYSNKIVIYLR